MPRKKSAPVAAPVAVPEKPHALSRKAITAKIAEAQQQMEAHANISIQYRGAVLAYQNLLAEHDEELKTAKPPESTLEPLAQ